MFTDRRIYGGDDGYRTRVQYAYFAAINEILSAKALFSCCNLASAYFLSLVVRISLPASL